MFDVTNFGLVLRICIVNTMIFNKKKNIGKLVGDQFLRIVKDHHYDHFGYVDKSMPCFFSFSSLIKNLSDKKSKNVHWSVLKIGSNTRPHTMITIFFIK